jgi:2-polyprenyl-3-methyl-5-hydroxy-6-metoxy-1,4-benzoquinol methylase
VVRCKACEQIYLHPLPSEEEIRALFTRLYTDGADVMPELQGYYRFCFDDRPGNPLVQLYESWLDAMERHRPPGRLLDVGCGTGLFLVVARRRGWRPIGVDQCEEAARHAVERFGCEVHVGSVESLVLGERLDAVTMWDILEHARRPVELLRTVRSALSPGGIVALATPNQRNVLDLLGRAIYLASGKRVTAPLEKFYVDQHFLYFTPESLSRILARAGLSAVELRQESTDLRRLTLSPPVRISLQVLFRIARWRRLENRMFAIARVAQTGDGPAPARATPL